MSPEVAELLKQIEGDIFEAAKRSGTPRDGSVCIRLRQDVHDTVYERIMLETLEGPEGYAVIFAGFPICRGAESMVEAWRFKRHEDLKRK